MNEGNKYPPDPNYLRNLLSGDWRAQERRESTKRENERIAQARRESQEAYEHAQEGAPDSEGEQSYMERMRERWERERKSQEVYERAQKAASDKRKAEIEAERKRMAEEQTAKDKARLKRDYLMAGGDPAL
jgi:colicin import membrane protein